MKLRSGFRLVVAPRFHDRLAWDTRLAVNDGSERRGDAQFPQPNWRSVSDDERQLLVDQCAADTLPADCAGLLVIPEHVRQTWWDAAEQSESLEGELPGYQRFVTQLVEFLSFKRLPLPAQCSFDVVASRPEQSSTRVNPSTQALAGLAHSAAGLPPLGAHLRTLAFINLGDEATHLVLCNLGRDDLHAFVPPERAPADTRGLTAEFLRLYPDYPLIRIRLEPGDGLWLPETGAIVDGWTVGKQEADVILTLTAGASTAVAPS